MSSATAGIRYTISQRLSGVTEDCSIVRGRQLRTLCHQSHHRSGHKLSFCSTVFGFQFRQHVYYKQEAQLPQRDSTSARVMGAILQCSEDHMIVP